MTLNIAICDDEAKEFEPLCHLLDICSFQFNIDLHIDTYTSAQALLTRYRESTGAPYQLLFLDIEMPGWKRNHACRCNQEKFRPSCNDCLCQQLSKIYAGQLRRPPLPLPSKASPGSRDEAADIRYPRRVHEKSIVDFRCRWL